MKEYYSIDLSSCNTRVFHNYLHEGKTYYSAVYYDGKWGGNKKVPNWGKTLEECREIDNGEEGYICVDTLEEVKLILTMHELVS